MAVIKINDQVTLHKKEAELAQHSWTGAEDRIACYSKIYQEDLDFLRAQTPNFGGTIQLAGRLIHSNQKKGDELLSVPCILVIAFRDDNPEYIFWNTDDFAIIACPPDDRNPRKTPVFSSIDDAVIRLDGNDVCG